MRIGLAHHERRRQQHVLRRCGGVRGGRGGRGGEPAQQEEDQPLRDLLDPACSTEELKQVGYPAPPDGWEKLGPRERERWAVQAAGGLSDDAVKAIVARSRSMGRRPPVFFRGYDVYDQDRAGFVADVGSEAGRTFTRFDVNVRGNGNQGHEFGLALSPAEKDALVEYMKGL